MGSGCLTGRNRVVRDLYYFNLVLSEDLNFNLINRRTHLYLGLALIPWVLMYGLTSLFFNHSPFFKKLFNIGAVQWEVTLEQEYHRPVPKNADLREVATEILDEFGFRNSFFVSRPVSNRININVRDFISGTRLTYYIDDEVLVVEERRNQFNTYMGQLHFRGGYQQDLFLDDLWALILDLVCVALVIWVASGIYMWWKLRKLRIWGAVALVAGLLSFGWLLLAL
jgi:hypothetical protein